MNVFLLDQNNAKPVAKLMTEIKPEWWPSFSDAYDQITSTDSSIGTVGWLMGDTETQPCGWVLCRELKCYNAIELECCGYNDDGVFYLEHKLEPLFNRIIEYAKEIGVTLFRTGMSSIDFNIDGQPIEDISTAIATLRSQRIDYQWLLEYGFRVIGIHPDAYGNNRHLILLGRHI